MLAHLARTQTSLAEHGENASMLWSPDGRRIVIQVCYPRRLCGSDAVELDVFLRALHDLDNTFVSGACVGGGQSGPACVQLADAASRGAAAFPSRSRGSYTITVREFAI